MRARIISARVWVIRGIATIREAARQSLGDAKAALCHREQHNAAVRGQATAVEIGCDFLTRDGWKRERQKIIVFHGGRGWRVVGKGLASTPKSYATSVPYAMLVNLKTRSA